MFQEILWSEKLFAQVGPWARTTLQSHFRDQNACLTSVMLYFKQIAVKTVKSGEPVSDSALFADWKRKLMRCRCIISSYLSKSFPLQRHPNSKPCICASLQL